MVTADEDYMELAQGREPARQLRIWWPRMLTGWVEDVLTTEGEFFQVWELALAVCEEILPANPAGVQQRYESWSGKSEYLTENGLCARSVRGDVDSVGVAGVRAKE